MSGQENGTQNKELQQGEVIVSPIDKIKVNSAKIKADQSFLGKVHGLADYIPLIAGKPGAYEHYTDIQSHFTDFCDAKLSVVDRVLMDRPEQLVRNEQENTNEYHPETKELFQEYAKEGYIGIAADERFGGTGMPKSLIGGAAFAGFNTNASFYLKEMVTQGAQNLLQGAYDAAPNDQQKELITNIMGKLRTGVYTGAMILTEPKTGANLGNNMECTTHLQAGTDHVTVTGEKKFITGFTTGGIDTVKNAIGLVVTATRKPNGELMVNKKGTTMVTVSLVPLYKIDEKGETILDDDGKPILNNIVTSHYISKPGIQNQILQEHDFKNSEGIALGTPGNGWPLMFGIMDPARHEVGAQAVAHIYTALQLAKEYTAKRGLDMRDQTSYGEFPQVAATIKALQSFAETGASVLMDAGLNLDYANLKDEKIPANDDEVRNALLARQAEAQRLTKIEMPFIKAYFTRTAKNLISRATQVMGTDGYTSRQVERLRNNLEPTPIYEGPNEMMAKQIVLQQFEMMDDFIRQTHRLIGPVDAHEDNTEETKRMIRDVHSALSDLTAATAWINDNRKLLGSKDPAEAELAARRIYAASDLYVDLMGAVYMGREALRTSYYIESAVKKGEEMTPKMQDRLDTARAAVHNFTLARPPLEKLKEEYLYAKPTIEVKELIELHKEQMGIESAEPAVARTRAVSA